uniref:WD repeat-containing protein 87-like n=1 Tax=Panthera onca TaxID=9690 RepID=UPI002954D971|nr:WD repeat-containing protein 87-like [Panthera onca]
MMSVKCWNVTKMAPSPRLIPEWKDLKLFINNMLKDLKSAEKPKNEVIVLSDWPETLYQEPHHPQSKPFICFYSININYFVSLNWVEPDSNQIQAVLWIQKKDTEAEGTMEKMMFCVMDQVPPIEAMVHTGSYHMLVAYCGDMHLWLFGDHHRAFISLGTVPCRFFISCLCYDPETEVLLSGTLGAVVTWLILPNGRDLQMAQTVPMSGHELVQGFSLNGPKGSLLALCENKVRVFTHQGQGQLKEVRKFAPIGSGSSITCSFTCVSQGYFYAGNKDGEIHAWSLDQGNFLHSFQAHSSSVICVHSRPEIHTLLTAGREGTVREWNLAVGNLLRQLEIGEGLRQLQFIDNTTFFCQTTHAFSLHHLPYFYSLFNVCGSAPEQVHRVCCGRNWTRILCATKDGLLRFLSPVTGDLLVLTWPLLVMDKAVAWAYDPDNEELFVATGSSEVLVFDATRSPCTAKYMVCTSVNSRDRVSCLAYAQSHLGMGLVGLMFCGHDSGIVRILSHYSYARIEKTVHSGAVLALSTLEGPQENSLLCSYGMDNTVYLTEALLWKNKVILQSISKILCSCPLQHVILLPGSVGAITDNHCWRLWHYQDFLQSAESKQSSMFEETKCLHRCAITSFDVCSSLKLFVTGGIDGSVRIWDFHGRLITELDSALHFGPLCFANNRGDLLLTFNQSLYLVSCLKLLPPARLIHLAILNNADEIQEDPKLFLPSFFFSFEIVLVPKFVYLGQGLQELQGLEALVNKRVIAFDNTVPHVVEEERRMPSLIQVEPKLHFLEDKDIAFSIPDPKHNRPPHVVPAQLRLAGWNGLNPYHKLHGFFGKGRQWPFAPDGYIPNSVIRACLWPDGTPVFSRHDLYPSYRDTDWDMTEPIRRQTLSPMPLSEENISMRRERDKSKWWKRTFYDVLTSFINRNWAGRKLDEGLLNNLIEAILSLTVYCSIDQYTTYISALAQIFATYQVSPRLCSETACRLLEDTLHPNPCIRELAWEGLDMLGIMSHLFAVPLSLGLMDSDENVRAKALYLMIRVTGIQSKSMLVGLLKEQETLQKMQRELIGETSLDQLLGIQANDIQCLLTRVEQQLNENLTLSHRDQQPPFSLDISMDGEPETFVKQHSYLKRSPNERIKKDLRVSRKKRETELVKFSSMLVPSEDEGEQREAKKSELIDTEDVALEPELPLSTFSPAKSEEVAESKEVMTEATEAMEATEEGRGHMAVTEAVEATQIMKAIDQHDMKDYGEIFPKLERQELMKRLWERAVEKSHEKVAAKLKQKENLKDISKTTAEEPKEKVMQIAEQEKDTRKKLGKGGQGLAGAPGHTGESDTRSWRNDICYLATARIASSHPGMLRDLGQELVDLARVILAPQEPSWDLFQEICPLLKDSSELEERVVEEPSTITEKVDKEIVEEEVTELGRQRGKEALEKDKAFSQVKKKKVAFLDKLALQKRKLKKEARGLARQDGKIAEEERKLSKPEKKLIQGKEKLIQDMKKLTHQKEKIAWEEKLLAYPQKTLTKEEQKLVLGEKKDTGKGKKRLGERKRVTQKEGRAALKRSKWDWEKIMMAHEEDMWPQEEVLPVWGERKLSQEEEELGEEDEELSEEEEEPCEEEKEFSEEESSEEEEELAWDEEELILDLKKQVKGRKKKSHKKKKHIQGIEKHVEEVAQKRGELAQEEEHLSSKEEGLSGEEEKQASERGSLAEQEIKLTTEKNKWLKKKKEAYKKKQIQENEKQVGKQEKEDQKERQASKEEKKAKDRQLSWERKKLGLGQEEKQGEKERRAQKEEKTTEKKRQWAWEKKKADSGEEEKAGGMKKWSQEEKKQAREEKRRDQKEEKMAQKVEKQAEDKKQWAREKMKLVPEEEKKIEEIEKVFPQKEKRAMVGEKQAKKEEKWVGKDRKATDKKEQQTHKEEQLALQEQIQAQGERIWGQKEEKESDKKKQRAWVKEKIFVEREEHAGEVEKKSQENEEKALKKRLTQKDSELAKEKRHIAKRKKAVARKGIGITKRKKKTKEEKEVVEEEELSQEERELAYDIRIKEMGVAKKKRKRTKEERIQAVRKLDMEKGICSEDKEASSRLKDIRKKESNLSRILAKTVRKMSIVLPEETEICEEERSFMTGKSEMDGQKWEFFKEQGEIMKEEKELGQEEGKVDDRLATKERTLTDGESLKENRKLLQKVQGKILLDRVQVESILKEVQEQNMLGKKQLKKLLRRIEKNKLKKTPLKWLLENIRDTLFEGLSESFIGKEIKEGPTKKGKEEESITEEEKEGILPRKEKGKYVIKKKKKKVSLSEEKLKENLAKKHKKQSSSQRRRKGKRLTQENERLSKKKKEGPHEEESLDEEEESLSEEEEKESLSEEEESLNEEEEESLSKEEEESLSQEEEESLSQEEEEESLSQEEEESLSQEEEESLIQEEKESLSQGEEESLSQEEMGKIEKREKEEERQKDGESRLMEVILPEEGVLKTELSKEEVSLSKLTIEDESLAEKRKGTTRRKMTFKKERLLDGKRDPTLRDKVMWPTVLKSPFKMPLPVALEKQRMPRKVLGDHLDLKGQESQLLGAHPETSSWRRQEDVLLEKARGMFLQGRGTGFQAQIPEGLHRPESHLSDMIRKPQKCEHRPKGDMWKWFLKSQDLPMGKTEGQVVGPALASAPSLTSAPAERPCYSEASFSDEDWINNALIRLEAGEQLSRNSFHRLHQLLRNLTSKGYLKWMRLYNLKAIAKHFRKNLEVSHADISQPYKDVLSPVHLKGIPPVRRKEKWSRLEPFPVVEAVLPLAATRPQTPHRLSWPLLDESYRKKQAQQLSSAVKQMLNLYPVRKDVPTTVYPSVDIKSLDLIFQKDFQVLREKGELPKFHKAEKEALPVPSPVFPSTTKRIQVPKAINWHLLGEPYRSARVQQLSNALKEMEMQHFYPIAREIFTGAHDSVDKQTLALMFQKDLRAFKGKDRPLTLPKLKKAQPVSKKKEKLPQWETFVALYYVLRTLQQRYAKDRTAWMERFYQLMDLYQFKSLQIQRLLLQLLQREALQPQETIYKNALKAKELVLGERLFCGLFCGHSCAPAGPLKFHDVVPLPGKSKVHTIQPVGIAQYGFLELAWKSLPQVSPYLIERPPNISTPTL